MQTKLQDMKKSAGALFFLLSHDVFDEEHDDGDGDDDDADEVYDDAGLNHLRDRYISRGIDDGVRWGGDGHHKAE